MEIKNYTSALNAYRYASEAASRPISGKAQKNRGKNTDKAEFSSSLKAAAKTAADSTASAERLAELSAKIADGSYKVSSEDIADSILGL